MKVFVENLVIGNRYFDVDPTERNATEFVYLGVFEDERGGDSVMMYPTKNLNGYSSPQSDGTYGFNTYGDEWYEEV